MLKHKVLTYYLYFFFDILSTFSKLLITYVFLWVLEDVFKTLNVTLSHKSKTIFW